MLRHVISIASLVAIVSSACMDTMMNCPDFISSCSLDYYQVKCPYTCQKCTNPIGYCGDTNTQCPSASTSLCSYPQYTDQCKESCGLCDGPGCIDHMTTCDQISKPCSIQVAILCPLYCGVCKSWTTVANANTTVPTTPTTVRTTVRPTTKAPVLTTTTKKPTTTTKPPPCKDTSPNCPTWAKNGFCTNTFYPPEKRKEYCAKTCKFC